MDTCPWTVVESSQQIFHDLISCVIEQQIHYRSTKKQFEKLLKQAHLEYLTIENFEEFEQQALTHIKLSGRKFETIAHVLEAFQAPQPDWKLLSDSDIQDKLGSIKGIGQWTVDMILMYTLEREDIFPAQDYHLTGIMKQLYQIQEENKKAFMNRIQEIASNWAPYRSIAVKYLLSWKTANKQKAL